MKKIMKLAEGGKKEDKLEIKKSSKGKKKMAEGGSTAKIKVSTYRQTSGEGEF